MVAVDQPVHEKLTLLWHNHFATSARKVRVAAHMAAQNQKLRTLSLGDFRTLAYTMLTDAAMLRWLDGQTNTAKAPTKTSLANSWSCSPWATATATPKTTYAPVPAR